MSQQRTEPGAQTPWLSEWLSEEEWLAGGVGQSQRMIEEDQLPIHMPQPRNEYGARRAPWMTEEEEFPMREENRIVRNEQTYTPAVSYADSYTTTTTTFSAFTPPIRPGPPTEAQLARWATQQEAQALAYNNSRKQLPNPSIYTSQSRNDLQNLLESRRIYQYAQQWPRNSSVLSSQEILCLLLAQDVALMRNDEDYEPVIRSGIKRSKTSRAMVPVKRFLRSFTS